jgi:acyl-[acyl-carrier-protein] desaturase
MSDLLTHDNPALQRRLWAGFREFFRKAERKRRWNVDEDIPWHLARPSSSLAIVSIIESFCAVELFLPDYVGKAIPMFRNNRTWSWSHMNWGYEEAKHSMALSDWLIKSGHRTEEYVADLATGLLQQEWNLPEEGAVSMLMYAMVQELATWLNYRNLRNHVNEHDDPCLWTILGFIQIDERAHHSYYKDVIKIFLEVDRQGSLERLKRVLNNFSMPASNLLGDTRQVAADIQAMEIFSIDIFYRDVYLPLLEDLGVSRQELRAPRTIKKSETVPTLK